MATTITPEHENKTLAVVHRPTAAVDPSVAAGPAEVTAPILLPAPEAADRPWFVRFLRTDPALPSPRDFVLAQVDPGYSIRSIQR